MRRYCQAGIWNHVSGRDRGSTGLWESLFEASTAPSGKLVDMLENMAGLWSNEALSWSGYGPLVGRGENGEGGPSLFFDVCYNTSTKKNRRGGPPDEILPAYEGHVK